MDSINANHRSKEGCKPDCFRDNALTQLAGTSGCISHDGSGGTCTDGRNLGTPTGIAFTSNGDTAYVSTAGGISIFDRNTSTGALIQRAGTAGCFNAGGTTLRWNTDRKVEATR